MTSLRALIGLAAVMAAAGLAHAASAQTVVLVRHAEKADQSADPDLSDAGRQRADALAAALSQTPLTHVFVTPLRRTARTAEPATRAHGLTEESISLDGDAHIARLAERVHALPPEAVALVVGHSNTIPQIVRALGAEAEDMTDCEYDRLTLVELRGTDEPVVVTARYGAVAPDCTSRH